ncbi:hypothetical protein WME77_29445 [Sorangium sp. So ce764]|uniref:hypothetical protein n=1 Tax=Sorangium sp. So ce764 TaxID=3133320 RepID=UPI003F639C9E
MAALSRPVLTENDLAVIVDRAPVLDPFPSAPVVQITWRVKAVRGTIHTVAMAGHQKGSIQLRLPVASTPERVLLAASLFDRIVKTAYPSLPSGTITMVVSNLNMTAGLRHYGTPARKAIDRLIQFVIDPETETARHPDSWSIADAFSDFADDLASLGAEMWTPKRKKPIAVFGPTFAMEIKRLAREKKPAPALRGTTIVYSAIYKVGRASEKSRYETARIEVDGQTYDVQIRASKSGPFYDAAKSKKVFAVHVDAAWLRAADGRLFFDKSRSRLTQIESWSPISGANLMQEVDALPPDMFADFDYLIDDELESHQ